ncbi:hypothetical protein IFM51744_08860 [Aspergillus udagawae]|uniref:HTH CENPB-type domain-containing protein n=1 Tax=Aspergillus udagawae TaxID=91492 RepID=A0ABQ1AWG4_9EURO|nr:hypothetical protein IFM51744_08860 [Aspergillus udagawae]GFF89324.1 hypothetical protein IFM53868_05799 [Aspergillus udagawae]GFG19679.1 hypothetical protein IFM5058_10262 [Aspergillus udagawae]
MPKSSKITESDLLKACEAAQAQEKPNISKIAREYGVPCTTLRDRIKKGRQPRTARKPVNKALEGYQEEALIRWIVWMRDHYLPVTPKLLQEYANQALQRAGEARQVSRAWAYRFEKRLPEHLKLGPVKQKTDINMPNLSTPSPPPTAISSSSIDVSPPRTIQALKKNQAKLSKHADLLTPKLRRNLERIFEHNRIAAEHLAMANETISRILKVRDAN